MRVCVCVSTSSLWGQGDELFPLETGTDACRDSSEIIYIYIYVENPIWNTGNAKHFFKSDYTFWNTELKKPVGYTVKTLWFTYCEYRGKHC